MTTKHFSVQTDGHQGEVVLWLINNEMGFKECKKCHNLLHAYINIQTGRQSRNVDNNQSRYQQNDSKLDYILKCRQQKTRRGKNKPKH
jgi:hypothetical protein